MSVLITIPPPPLYKYTSINTHSGYEYHRDTSISLSLSALTFPVQFLIFLLLSRGVSRSLRLFALSQISDCWM